MLLPTPTAARPIMIDNLEMNDCCPPEADSDGHRRRGQEPLPKAPAPVAPGHRPVATAALPVARRGSCDCTKTPDSMTHMAVQSSS